MSASTDLPVTVSIGLTAFTGDARGALLTADAALYEAKGAGRDRIVARAPSRRAPTSNEAGS